MKTESEFWALMFLVIAIASFVAQFIQVMVFSFEITYNYRKSIISCNVFAVDSY